MYEEYRNDPGAVEGRQSKNVGKGKALIIAVSEYDPQSRLRQLPFCKNDGEAIYDVLRNQKYDISEDRRLIGRVGGEIVRRRILDFFGKSAKEDDMLFFYFSGHGIPDSIGDHYLAFSDIDKEYPEENGFRFLDLEKMMTKSNAKKIVVVLDCCLAGAIGAEAKGGEEAEEAADKAKGEMSQVFENANGRCVFASSLEGQSSYPMKGSQYSLFTHHLLEGLKGGAADENGYVTPMKLSNYVFGKIPLARQKPITKISMSGDIIITEYPDLRKSLPRLANDGVDRIITTGRAVEPDIVNIPAGNVKLKRFGTELEVRVQNVSIASFPVTNLQFAEFVAEGGTKPPRNWFGYAPPTKIKDSPVVWVRSSTAARYCRWLSEKTARRYRLPTEAEWVKAVTEQGEAVKTARDLREWATMITRTKIPSTDRRSSRRTIYNSIGKIVSGPKKVKASYDVGVDQEKYVLLRRSNLRKALGVHRDKVAEGPKASIGFRGALELA